MRILHGESHDPTSHNPTSHERFRSGAAVTLTLLATAIFALAADPVGVVALLPAAALAAHQGVRQLKHWRRRPIGDWLVGNLLRELSDDFYLVQGVTPGRRSRLGHILIGPCGVLVIETRRTRGRVLCYGQRWYVNGWRRRGFGRRINRSAFAVHTALRRWCPEEAASLLRVEPLVVFTHPHCRLNVYRPRIMVTRYSELLQKIWALERRHILPADAARRLAEALARGPAEMAPSESPLTPAVGW